MPIPMFLTMLLCFALSISIAVSIGLASIVGAVDANLNLLTIVKEMFGALNKFPLAAIPFFILAGNLMESGGISNRLVEFAKSLVGGVQGGLSATCVLTCMIFAAVSGQQRRDHVRHRLDPHSGARPARLSGELRRGVAGDVGGARRDHSAVDTDDPVRRLGGSVDRRALHRGLRPGRPDRRRADGVRAGVRAAQGLRKAGPRRTPAGARGHAQGRVRPAHARDHPGRHLRRRVHAHRSIGRRGVLRAGRRAFSCIAR